jgi:hypothetical protein
MNDEKDPPDFARSAQRNQSSAQTPERLPAMEHWPGSTLLFQQANLEIFWDDRGWLYVDWVGMQSITNVREGCEQMMRFLQLKAVDSVLNDFSRMEGMWIREPRVVGARVVSNDDSRWIENDLLVCSRRPA